MIKKTSLISEISIRNKYWAQDLEQWGVIPRKTYNFIEPKIKTKYLGWYIKGLFDGDGSIETKNNGTISLVSIAGNPQFINWLQENIPIDCAIYKRDKQCHVARIYNKNNFYRFYYWCHGEMYPRLDRKWSILEKCLLINNPLMIDKSYIEWYL